MASRLQLAPAAWLCWLVAQGLWSPCLADEPAQEQAAREDELEDELEDDLGLADEFALLEEESVVYTAAKHRQSISDAPSTVTVITRSQIETSPCSDLVCLLRQVPELEVRRYRPLYQTVGARALGTVISDKGLVLVDGREINIEAFGLPFWAALPVHLTDIERIEVIRGPGSSLYGANAHSMVVSITTRKPGEELARVHVGAGEHGSTDLHLRLGERWGAWRVGLTGGLETTGDWERSDTRLREVYRGRLVAERDWFGGTTRLDAGVIGVEGLFYTAIAPCQLTGTLQTNAQLSHQNDWLKAHLWFDLLKTDIEFDLPLVYQGIELGRFPDNISVLSTSLDGDVQVDWSFFAGNLVIVGLNYRWLTFQSEANDPPMTHQHRLGVFAQFEQRLWDQLLATAGVRVDYNSITPLTWSPRLALVWRFDPHHLLRTSFGRAFRKPSFLNTSIGLTTIEGSAVAPNLDEFFRRNIGNPDLDNESITAVELGYRGEVPAADLVLEANGFVALYRSNINFVTEIAYNNLGLPDLSCPTGGGPCASSIQFRNEGWEINTAGGSASLSWRPQAALRVRLNYTYRYSWYAKDAPGGSGGTLYEAGDHYDHEPAHLANLVLGYAPDWGLRLGLAVHAHSSMHQRRSEDGTLFGPQVDMRNPPSWFASASLGWRLTLGDRWVEASLKAYNMLNLGFRDATAVTRADGELMGAQLIGRRVMFILQVGL